MKIATTARRVLRVVLYARVSAERDARSKSVNDQLAELRRWADREGWHLVAELRDDGVSASRFGRGRDRPGWQQVMDHVQAGEVDAVLVWEISRASRDRPVFAALFAACADAGVSIGTGGRLHDLDDGDDAFVLDLGAALAVRETAVLSRRVRRAVESRAAAGRPAGSVPYGYKRVLDPDTGRAVGRVKHPDQAPIVKEVVERLLARETADSIARDLNERGVPTGTSGRWLGRHLRAVERSHPDHPVTAEVTARLAAGELPKSVAADLNARGVPHPAPSRWVGGNLARLALRPTYAGLRVHRGHVLDEVRGTWPAIITEEQHHALVELYAAPERDRFRNGTDVRHLGSGIFRCGREGCTGRMRVFIETANGRPNRYGCRVCHKVSRLQEPVDTWVTYVLCERLARPDVIAELSSRDDPAVAEAGAEAVRLKRKLRQARDAWSEDRLSLEAYTDMEARTLPLIRSAEDRARPKHLPAALYDLVGPGADGRWKALPIGEQRAILAAMVDVVILPAGRGKNRFDPADVVITPRR